ncbi:non-structural maintenance of chromosomes element 4 homolog A-like [Malania oleifera]|uniref:non-structural maintenance of chromosomes element 4 homolog A-like n=1 Tax=Malania oleifera TaxID=397392 RepID=UPI0025AE3C0F|nr:non-structural maintenance of chromosomes element 4 homolog A-like [Malania oleifera]
MSEIVKREPATSSCSRAERSIDASVQELKVAKRERLDLNADPDQDDSTQPVTNDPRIIRSRYVALKSRINDERDDLSSLDSDKFRNIISEVENLHHLVQKPREQVADAEALLDIANTLVCSVKSQSSEGFSPSDFVSCLLREFGQQGRRSITENAQDSILWKDIGLAVSPMFSKYRGCSTMLGPLNTEVKKRKVAVSRRCAMPTSSVRPEEVDNVAEERTDTDKNMSTMFDILRKKKIVRLESLMLNRKSFAQTVENLFALSFLVKDGRVEVSLDDKGSHFVSPRNAPAANSILSREVSYSHFMFRFDFNDWKLMMDLVPVGEELMPHRCGSNISGASQADSVPNHSQATLPATPIITFSRNRGRVVQEKLVVQNLSEIGNVAAAGDDAIHGCKRKLSQ